MVRAKIILNTKQDIDDFINCFDSDDYIITDKAGHYKVAATSLIGALYAWEKYDNMYVVNETRDGHFPAAMDRFRAE